MLMCTKQAELKANKLQLLQGYLHTVNLDTFMPQCPLCLTQTNDTNHLFNCSQVQTQHHATCFCKKPLEAAEAIKE